jgi:hypothetical protein
LLEGGIVSELESFSRCSKTSSEHSAEKSSVSRSLKPLSVLGTAGARKTSERTAGKP